MEPPSRPVSPLMGYEWRKYPRTLLDGARCLLGAHRRVEGAQLPEGLTLKCSCGAVKVGREPWMTRGYQTRLGPRRGEKVVAGAWLAEVLRKGLT